MAVRIMRKLYEATGGRPQQCESLGNLGAVKADAAAIAPTRNAVAEIERTGITSLRAIGRELAARGIRPPSGGTWQATQVARLRP